MADENKEEWFPGVVIGLGGTGVRTLRNIRLHAELDPAKSELRKKLKNGGALQLVAIDTDWKANSPAEVSADIFAPALRDHIGQHHDGLSHDTVSLPTIEDLLSIRTTDITRALDTVRRGSIELDGDGLTRRREHEAIARWFPIMDAASGDEITMGQSSRDGAGQWRPLGRIGFFLNVSQIHQRLTEAVERARRWQPKTMPLRCHIVCSLAGGTGAGMFWDIAFLLRKIDENCVIRGNFLLPDPFEAVDDTRRLKPNAYAALKELATFKNWRQRNTLTIDYPVGDQGITFKGVPGGVPAFDTVFLYQSFAPDPNASDLAGSTIAATHLRMAENILAQLRQDIHVILDEGANNESGDSSAMRSEREGSFVFSTSTTTPVALVDTVRASQMMESALLGRVRARIAPDTWTQVKGATIATAFGLKGNASNAENALLETWIIAALERLPKDGPKAMLAAIKALEQAAEAAKELNSRKHGFKALLEETVTLYRSAVGYAPSKEGSIGDQWSATLLAHRGEKPFKAPVALLGTTACLYRDDVKVLADDVRQRLAEIEREMRAARSTLTKRAEDELKAVLTVFKGAADNREGLSRTIEALVNSASKARKPVAPSPEKPSANDSTATPAPAKASEHPAESEPSAIREIVAPTALLALRILLGIDRPGDEADAKLKAVQDKCHNFPLGEALALLLSETAERLKAQIPQANMDRSYAVEQYLIGHHKGIVDSIQGIMSVHEENSDILKKSSWALGDNYYKRYHEMARLEASSRLEDLLHPLRSLLKKIPDDERGKESFRKHARGCVESIRRQMPSEAVSRSPLLNFEDSNEASVIEWSNIYDIVRNKFKKDTGESDPVKPSTDHVVDALSDYLLPNPQQLFPDEFDRFTRMVMTIGRGFIQYWIGQPEFMVTRFGDEQGIAQRIQDCSTEVFAGGTIQNGLKKIKLVIAPPAEGFAGMPDSGGAVADSLKQAFKRAAQTKLGVPPRFCRSATMNPIIYYEDLYRSGKEIGKIRDYHEAYAQRSPVQRRFFHVLPDIELADIITDAQLPREVLCGNPDCSHNIRDLSPDRLICPKCERPILNRCGNTGCTEVNLRAHIEQNPATGPGQINGIPFDCPVCRKEIRTYWWRCREPLHAKRTIRTDHDACPLCLEEHRDGSRPLQEISRFGDKRSFECPGCQTLRYSPKDINRIPASLLTFFNDGIPPSKEASFREIAQHERVDFHHCKNREHIHFLFPTCPEGSTNPATIHHLYRRPSADNGSGPHPFLCADPKDRHLRFHTCFHCGFPIQGADSKAALERQKFSCPRCLRELRHCHFCSHRDDTLFAPHSGQGEEPERCPRCTNLMLPLENFHRDVIASGLLRPAFCRNLFDCRAGAAPWSTTADFRREDCRACGDERHSQLLPFDDLDLHVCRCPICLILIGVPDGNRVRRYTPRQVLQHFSRMENAVTSVHSDCVICGTQPAAVLKWFAKGDYLTTASDENGTEPFSDDDARVALSNLRLRFGQNFTVPDLPVLDAMEILRALRNCRKTQPLYETLKNLSLFDRRRSDFDRIEGEFDMLFKTGTVASKAIKRRIGQLKALHLEITQREG